MSVFPGTVILNTNGSGADNPATSPILLVPAGGMNIVGFAFTNPSNTAIIVSVYRDVIGATGLLFAPVTVPALSGMPGGPAVVQVAISLSLAAGETIYAQSSNLGGIVNVEIDGLVQTASGALSVQQLLLANIFMMHEAYGVDIPDAQTLNNGYIF